MQINLFLTDLDGCLTDGGYYVFSEYSGIAKRFNTRDFMGMQRLFYRLGVNVGVITTAKSAVLQNQLDRCAQYVSVVTGSQDKAKDAKEKWGTIDWSNISYIGDDINDLELLQTVGMAACPADAHFEVLDMISNRKDGFVMKTNGGHGCVREFADMVYKVNLLIGF